MRGAQKHARLEEPSPGVRVARVRRRREFAMGAGGLGLGCHGVGKADRSPLQPLVTQEDEEVSCDFRCRRIGETAAGEGGGERTAAWGAG